MSAPTRLSAIVPLLLVAGCRDVALPPAPGLGSIQGVAVYAVPGRTGFRPASNTTVEVLGTSLVTTSDADGRFALTGVAATKGSLLLRFAPADGPVRQRMLSLATLGAGPNRTVALGEVVLSQNGAVQGRVSLEGASPNQGLGGTVVFVPGARWSTYTADDGSYLLEGLPEGAFQLAFFHRGYAQAALDVTLAAAEEKTLVGVQLARAVDQPARVTGRVLGPSGPATDATVRMKVLALESTLAVGADGKFEQGDLTPGVYAFAFSRPGSATLKLDNVLLPPGETDLGSVTLVEGQSTVVALEPPRPPADAGTNDAGAVDAGPIDAGPTDAGATDAGSNDAGLTDAGTTDAGSTDAGTSDAGPSDAGATDAGTSDAGAVDAGVDAGSTDAGGADAGAPPVAIVSGPALVAPATQVNVSGVSSTGSFPLIYRWTQTSGPAVTLTTNNLPTSHSPRFTAPAAGNVVELALVVEDRFGVTSAPATLRVAVGQTPVARFTPDGGLVLGSQLVSLTATTVDDAGVALVGFDWQLLAGTGGTLVADGGPSALWQVPAVAFGAPDVLGGVTLRVTSAIGVTSAPTTNLFTIRGASPNNWSIDAGTTLAVAVGAVPPQVTLNARVTTTLASPQYAVAWSCDGGVSLLGADTLTPTFLAPAMVGAQRTLPCSVVATGQPPLDPPTVTARVDVLLRDALAPSTEAWVGDSTRMGRFGIVARATEPLASGSLSLTCSPSVSFGLVARIFGRTVVGGPSYTPISEGATCGTFYADYVDRAVPSNSRSAELFGPASVVVQTVWTGPYESTQTFDDPRPVVAALSQAPLDIQELNGVTSSPPPGFEVVAAQGGSLVRFSGLDLSARPTCTPSCPLNATTVALGLAPGAYPPVKRALFGGAELFVPFATDGGQASQVARRSALGTWSRYDGVPGIGGNWALELRTVRFEPDGGLVLLDTYDPTSGSFTTTDTVLTGQTALGVAAVGERVVAAAVGPSRQLVVRLRQNDLSWTTLNTSAPYTNVLGLRMVALPGEVSVALVEHSAGALGTQRVDAAGQISITAGPVQGWDMAMWGSQLYVVYALAGDIRFKSIAGSVFSGAGGGPTDFGGPPRPGFMAPYPVVLDGDPLCEAAYPQFAFVNEALVITWQERCSPATQWKVMARVVR